MVNCFDMMKSSNWDYLMIKLLALFSLKYTGGKVLGCDEGIKLGSTDGKFFCALLGILDGISLGLYVGTDIVYLGGSFDGSNYGNLEVSLIGESLGYTDGKAGII